MSLHWGKYETLRPHQIDAIREKTPVAFVPWGAIEWHSYHNPIGLDGLKAHGLCAAVARETGGVVLPPMFVGTDVIKDLIGFKHTFSHSAEVVRGLIREVLEQLADEGFRVIVLCTGHYGAGQVKAVEEVAQAFREAHPEIGLWAFPDSEVFGDDYPGNHAAHGETSLQLVFGPEYVDLNQLPADRVATLDDDGVLGEDPRTATQADGLAMVRLFVERAAPRVRAMAEEFAQ